MSKVITLSRISAAISSIGLRQIAVEPNPDTHLGFRMWGGKDSHGVSVKFLAKDRKARITELQVTSLGTGFLRSNIEGFVFSSPLSANDLPNHNNLKGLQGGDSNERYHLTLSQLNTIHSPATVSAPLAIDAQHITLKYSSDFSLNAQNELRLSANVIKADGTVPFVAPVIGVTPTAGSHLTTKDYVKGLIQGIEWLNSVNGFYDPSNELPENPNIGDRWISSVTANGWTKDYIYEYTGTAWAEIPVSGVAVTVNKDTGNILIYNQNEWDTLSPIGEHNQLTGLQGGTATERYHLTEEELISLQNLSSIPYTKSIYLERPAPGDSVIALFTNRELTIKRVSYVLQEGTFSTPSMEVELGFTSDITGSLNNIHSPLTVDNKTTGQFVTTGLTNVSAGNWIILKITSSSGDARSLTCTIEYEK